MPQASPYRLKLTNMEMSTLSKGGYRYNSAKVIRVITGVYIFFTVAAALSLAAGFTNGLLCVSGLQECHFLML